jgi:hypothetical protein
MGNKYFVYALLVTVIATGTNWVRMFGSASNSGGRGGGSSWSSHSGGGYGGGYGGGGGGHK